MSLTPSSMLPLDTKLPHFSLWDTVSGATITSSDYKRQPLLVFFICNHCPYVVHIIDKLVNIANEAMNNNVDCIAISSNDINTHPADNPANMTKFAKDHQFRFPYCFDETQCVAKAFHAECTPDLFLFNSNQSLFYRGRFDEATPGNNKPIDGRDLTRALDALNNQLPPPPNQSPSVGCNIKWRQ